MVAVAAAAAATATADAAVTETPPPAKAVATASAASAGKVVNVYTCAIGLHECANSLAYAWQWLAVIDGCSFASPKNTHSVNHIKF